MSAILFVPISDLAPASTFGLVTLVVALLTITPSITYNGSVDPCMVPVPLILIEIAPEGSPLVCVICAPGTFPCNAAVKLPEPELASALPPTEFTVLPNCFLVCVSDEPITTTSSKPRASFARSKFSTSSVAFALIVLLVGL